jgi:Protein of unknown function (DUF2628)
VTKKASDMSIYTVHEPPPKAAGSAPEPERFVFVRDGFSFWAFLLAPLWMLRHRMWLVLLGYLVVTIALQVGLSLIGASATVVAALLSLLVGFEAATLRRFTLGRRRWTNVGIVVGDDTETAEQRFFDAWVDRGGSDSVASGGSWASAPPASAATVLSAPLTRRPTASPDVIGLFPEPGASR